MINPPDMGAVLDAMIRRLHHVQATLSNVLLGLEVDDAVQRVMSEIAA